MPLTHDIWLEVCANLDDGKLDLRMLNTPSSFSVYDTRIRCTYADDIGDRYILLIHVGSGTAELTERQRSFEYPTYGNTTLQNLKSNLTEAGSSALSVVFDLDHTP